MLWLSSGADILASFNDRICHPASSPIARNMDHRLVTISGRVIFWTHDQASALLRSLIDCLDDIDQLLFVFKNPVELVVISSTKIAHLQIQSGRGSLNCRLRFVPYAYYEKRTSVLRGRTVRTFA